MRLGLASVLVSGLVALTLVGATGIMLAMGSDGNASPAAVDGRTLFQRNGCIGCHTISAAGLRSPIGVAPELSALAQVAPTRRPGMTADAYVRESIRVPRAYLVPGFGDLRMPTLPVSDVELDALVGFLLSDHR